MKHSIKNKGIKRVTTLLAKNVIVNSQMRKTLRIIWNTIIPLKNQKNPWKQNSPENATPKKILLMLPLNLMLMGKKQRLFPHQLTRKAMPIKCILVIYARWGIFSRNFRKPNSNFFTFWYLVQLNDHPILRIPNFNFPNLRCCKVFFSFFLFIITIYIGILCLFWYCYLEKILKKY